MLRGRQKRPREAREAKAGIVSLENRGRESFEAQPWVQIQPHSFIAIKP